MSDRCFLKASRPVSLRRELRRTCVTMVIDDTDPRGCVRYVTAPSKREDRSNEPVCERGHVICTVSDEGDVCGVMGASPARDASPINYWSPTFEDVSSFLTTTDKK